MSASSLPRCSNCGNERGPWRPTGEFVGKGEQVFVCQDGCPESSPELVAAVADMGALPMPAGPDRLTEILARADAATPGPWCTDAWEIYQGTEYLPGLSWWIGETCRGTSTPEQDRADATFVAAARTDVPDLVSAVRLLRARVAELEAAVNCPSQMTVSSGTSRCALPVRHRSDHRNAAKTHFWSDEYSDATRVRPAEDPHDSPLHHRYDTPRDLPEVPR